MINDRTRSNIRYKLNDLYYRASLNRRKLTVVLKNSEQIASHMLVQKFINPGVHESFGSVIKR